MAHVYVYVHLCIRFADASRFGRVLPPTFVSLIFDATTMTISGLKPNTAPTKQSFSKRTNMLPNPSFNPRQPVCDDIPNETI